MEKDSFEELLRSKVLQAESTLNPTASKEKVWNIIQEKQQPKRRFYYAAAAILLVIGSIFYIKSNEAIIMVTKVKKGDSVTKPLPNSPAIEPLEINQPITQVEKADVEPRFAFKRAQTVPPIANVVVGKKDVPAPVLPILDDDVVVMPKNVSIEKAVSPTSPVTVVPEFTVQLKRGVTIIDHSDENIIITSLRKFKLKRDTTYFANAGEIQSTRLKLTFKKEN
jgi:hypothetical protein